MRTRIGSTVAAMALLVPAAAQAQEAPVWEVGAPVLAAPVYVEPPGPEQAPSVTVEVSLAPSAPAPAPPPAPAALSQTPEEVNAQEELPPPPEAIFLHGFRLGYLHITSSDTLLDPAAGPESQTYAQRYDMRSAHLFMLGYEAVWRMVGHDWLNLLLIGNIMIAGLEQSRFFPSANLMLGFEVAGTAQVGIGVSVTPTKEDPAHMVFAAGWTPRIGSFYVPVHAFFVPDIAGHHKIGLTVGVSFF